VAEFNTVEAADKVSILKYFEPFWQN
jgi:hypothetical protein